MEKFNFSNYLDGVVPEGQLTNHWPGNILEWDTGRCWDFVRDSGTSSDYSGSVPRVCACVNVVSVLRIFTKSVSLVDNTVLTINSTAVKERKGSCLAALQQLVPLPAFSTSQFCTSIVVANKFVSGAPQVNQRTLTEPRRPWDLIQRRPGFQGPVFASRTRGS